MSLTLVRDVFARASGLRTHHAALRYKGNKQIIEFDGFDKCGKRFHVESNPTSVNPMAIAAQLGRQKAIDMATVTGDLSSSIRDRIAKARDKAAKAREHIHGALDQIDGAAADTDAVATALEKEAAELQAALGIISNGAPE